MAEAGAAPEPDRREADRKRYLSQATLQPANQPGEELTLYTRDLTGQGVGFIATGELPADGRAMRSRAVMRAMTVAALTVDTARQ